MLGHGTGQRDRVGVAGMPEGEHLREFAGGQRCRLRCGQRRVRTGGAPYRLCRVVDQDVQWSKVYDRIGQGNYLRRVSQVDTDDPRPVDPVGVVLHRHEAADGVVGEPGGDGGVSPVAEQTQRNVHADLGAAAGEQRPPSVEVGASIPSAVVQLGTRRAQLVIERVHRLVVLLADVTGARAEQGARRCAGCIRRQRDALRFIIDPVGRTSCGGGDHCAVGGRDGLA